MAVFGSVVVFLVGLLIGGLGIYVGASVIVGAHDYGHAVITALLGAIVWAVVGALFGWIPLLGPVLTFLAYLLVIRVRYRAGWLEAAGIALVAWIAVLAILYVLEVATFGPLRDVDIPGVPGV